MIKAIPVIHNHFLQINPRECFVGDKEMLARCELAAQYGFSHTLTYNGHVIAIIGGHLLFKGVMEVWTIISDRIKLVARAFHKKVLDLISVYSKALSLARMQMVVRKGFPVNYNWAEALGFHEEALMEKYGPDGDDYYLFARLF